MILFKNFQFWLIIKGSIVSYTWVFSLNEPQIVIQCLTFWCICSKEKIVRGWRGSSMTPCIHNDTAGGRGWLGQGRKGGGTSPWSPASAATPLCPAASDTIRHRLAALNSFHQYDLGQIHCQAFRFPQELLISRDQPIRRLISLHWPIVCH